MSGDGQYVPNTRFAVAAVTGVPSSSWCTACKAYTLVVTPLYFLMTSGVTTARPLSLCSVCDDMD